MSRFVIHLGLQWVTTHVNLHTQTCRNIARRKYLTKRNGYVRMKSLIICF